MWCRYVRPEIVGEEEQPQLVIRGGRHPVLAAMMAEAQVVPNDTLLGGATGPRACIITGPNMGCASGVVTNRPRQLHWGCRVIFALPWWNS